MIDWAEIHAKEIAPVLQNFSTSPPPVVLAILAAAVLSGIALVIWAPGRLRLAGVVLIFIAIFASYMVLSGARRARQRPAHYEYGSIVKKYSKKSTSTDSRGMIEPVTTYYIEMNVSTAHEIRAEGQAGPVEAAGTRKLSADEELYGRLAEGDRIYAIVLPTADDAIHFAVREDGTVVR